MERYNGGPDFRRLSSSVDYSSQLSSMGVGKDKLDSGGGGDSTSLNDYHHSAMQPTREMSNSNSNLHQVSIFF